jgi:hypothetical protein
MFIEVDLGACFAPPLLRSNQLTIFFEIELNLNLPALHWGEWEGVIIHSSTTVFIEETTTHMVENKCNS